MQPAAVAKSAPDKSGKCANPNITDVINAAQPKRVWQLIGDWPNALSSKLNIMPRYANSSVIEGTNA